MPARMVHGRPDGGGPSRSMRGARECALVEESPQCLGGVRYKRHRDGAGRSRGDPSPGDSVERTSRGHPGFERSYATSSEVPTSSHSFVGFMPRVT